MNVLLLRPPPARKSFLDVSLAQEPLTQLFLAPRLARGHDVRLADMRAGGRLARVLRGFTPDVAVVGLQPRALPALGATLADLRRRFPRIRILLTGDAEYGVEHIREQPLEFTHPLADALVPGYYVAHVAPIVEQAIAAWQRNECLENVPGLLVNAREGSWQATAPVPHRIGDPGLPDRRLLARARRRYRFAGIADMAFVFNTYGCPYRCRFCTMSKHDASKHDASKHDASKHDGSKHDAGIWVRDRGELLRELLATEQRNVFLTDFEPLQAPDVMLDLAQQIERLNIRKSFYWLTRADSALAHLDVIERWKRVGLRAIYLGLDGHSDARLREERKAMRTETGEQALRALAELGVGVIAGFAAAPYFSDDDFDELADYVHRVRPPIVGFMVETPLPGTTWFDEVESKLTTRDWSLFDLHHAVLPTSMPLSRFYSRMARLHMLSGRLSMRGMLEHVPIRDLMRSYLGGPAAIARVLRSARDHGPRRAGAATTPAAAHSLASANAR